MEQKTKAKIIALIIVLVFMLFVHPLTILVWFMWDKVLPMLTYKDILFMEACGVILYFCFYHLIKK